VHSLVPRELSVGWSRERPTTQLDLGESCNDHCSFCPIEGEVRNTLTLNAIKLIQDEARAEGCEQLFLTGGEPTLRMDLGAIVRNAAKRGLTVGLRTNARRFASPGYALMLAKAGLGYAEVGFYGPQGIHDKITEDRSYEQAVVGIDALIDAGIKVVLRCTVVAANSDHLDFLTDFAVERPGLSLAYTQPAPSGRALTESGVLLPLSIAAKAVDEALLRARSKGVAAEAWGFPQCSLYDARELARIEPYTVPTNELSAMLKPPACARCGAYHTCPGVTSHAYASDDLFRVEPIMAETRVSSHSLRGVPIMTTSSGFRPPEISRLDTSPRYPDTALITLIVAGCDLNCIFCETPQGDNPPSTSSLVGVKGALTAMRSESNGVYFTGGEPSSVPWLFAALGFAQSLGYARIQMQSHAGRASEPAYADRLVEAGLTAIDVPFYGHNAFVHETITNTPGSFDRTTRGLLNLKERGVEVCVHITLFESNLDSLPDVLAFWNGLGPSAAYVQTAGEVGQPGTYERVAPSPTLVGTRFEDAIVLVPPEFPLFITDVAPCHLGPETQRLLRWQGGEERNATCMVLPYSDWLMTFTAGSARVHGKACVSCQARPSCDGLSPEALEHFGETELKPF
jgi:MoaA/NifB/PqqE/SkfB family radical SAM enzyme